MNNEVSSLSKLEQNLHKEIYRVKFTKKDNTIREMICTLREDYIPDTAVSDSKSTTKRKTSLDVIAVWDLEKSEWRSFRKDSVIEYSLAT